MDRRRFLQRTAVATAAAYLPGPRPVGANGLIDLRAFNSTLVAATNVDVAGHTLICEFTMDSTKWKVYEDLRTREGAITFISSAGARVLTKSAEASFAEETSPYLGLTLKDIGMSARDLLAERLLEGGNDPDPDRVKSAAPPLGSVQSTGPSWRLPWDTFVGTKECFDTMPVFSSGSTRTYHPVQFFPEHNQKAAQKRFAGQVGGGMPAVRKILPASAAAD